MRSLEGQRPGWCEDDKALIATSLGFRTDDCIANAFQNAASAGIALMLDPWEASVRVRHLGPYPLIEGLKDDSVRDPEITVANVRAARKIRRFNVYGEVLNILDSRDKIIAYFNESYTPSFDTSGPTDGRLSHVVEPRTLRLGARVNF